jgi:hypothetical protein
MKAFKTLMCLASFAFLACGGMELPEDQEEQVGSNEAALINNGGGPTGLGFTCGGADFPGTCSCDGPADSQDCQDMKRNCADEIKCGWAVDNCTCKMKKTGQARTVKFSGSVGVVSGELQRAP